MVQAKSQMKEGKLCIEKKHDKYQLSKKAQCLSYNACMLIRCLIDGLKEETDGGVGGGGWQAGCNSSASVIDPM